MKEIRLERGWQWYMVRHALRLQDNRQDNRKVSLEYYIGHLTCLEPEYAHSIEPAKNPQ